MSSLSSSVQDELVLYQNRMKQFRIEQEKIILDMQQSREKGCNSFMKSSFVTGDANVGRSLLPKQLIDMLNADTLIVPTSCFSGGRSKWPNALVANFANNKVELGFMEDLGSVWNIIKLDNVNKDVSTQGVVLKSKEIGETDRFLAAELQLVEDVQFAAHWTVRIARNAPTDSLFHEQAATSSNGVLVQFELSSESELESEPKLLVMVCPKSTQLGHVERYIAALSEKECSCLDDRLVYTQTWEIIREDTPVEGLESLGEEFDTIM